VHVHHYKKSIRAAVNEKHMLLLTFLLPLLITSVTVRNFSPSTRLLPTKISFDDATNSLQKWAASSAASKSPNAAKSVVNIIESDGAGLRAGDYLIGRWFSTKSKANSACRNGKVSLNGNKIYASRVLGLGDLLHIDFTEDDPPVRSAEEVTLAEAVAAVELHRLVNFTRHILDERRYPPLHILFEDDDIAVVFKPSGIHSMKWVGTMKKKLFALDDILPLVLSPPEIISHDGSDSSDSMKRPLPCHRLDARVSGCLIVAKTQRAMSDLSKQFENRYVEKEYIAILAGNLTECLHRDSAISKMPMIEWADDSNSMVSTSARRGRVTDPIDGFDATTELMVLDISPCSVYGALTTVSLFPRTGRRHQLRRHCAAMGCPIVGDDLYHAAGILPIGDRMAAIEALSVGKVKIIGSSMEDSEYDSDESEANSSNEGDSASAAAESDYAAVEIITTSQSESSGPTREGVRKKVGIFLMCTALEFYHPKNTVSGLTAADLVYTASTDSVPPNPGGTKELEAPIDRVKIQVRCEESPRFIRLKEKARKGYEWQLAQGASTETST
jgi:23S rRNA-/tRNA-specific pseudouridylate synthase